MKAFVYLVRRELWENRSIWLTPLAISAIIVLAYIAGIAYVYVHGGTFGDGQAITLADRQHAREGLLIFYMALTGLFNLVLIITIVRYLLHSLYGDRKDRSILFWQSLPLSNTATVLSKLTVAMVIAPLVTFALLLVVQLVGAGALSAVAAKAGSEAVGVVWSQSDLPSVWAFLVVGFLVQSLWYLPFYGWLMMASAWARQAPVMWAAVPPLVAGILELILLGTSHFFNAIGIQAVSVLPAAIVLGGSGHFPANYQGGAPSLHRIAEAFVGAEMWVGIAIGVVFVAIAVVIRRYREDV